MHDIVELNVVVVDIPTNKKLNDRGTRTSSSLVIKRVWALSFLIVFCPWIPIVTRPIGVQHACKIVNVIYKLNRSARYSYVGC